MVKKQKNIAKFHVLNSLSNNFTISILSNTPYDYYTLSNPSGNDYSLSKLDYNIS